MQATRNERELLNKLSKEVFGASTRWQKLVDKGDIVLVTEDKEEEVPEFTKEDGTKVEATKRTVKVPVLDKLGRKQYNIKRYTNEEALQLMLDLKQQLDNIKAQIAKQKEEKAKKDKEDAARKVISDELKGTAL